MPLLTTQPHHNRRAPGVKLTRHVRGWVAKIGGKVKWLAPIDKPQLAMERYHAKMKDHLDSRTAPPVRADNNASLGLLGDLFLASKAAKVEAGELKPRTFADYQTGIQRAINRFGMHVPALSIDAARWQEYRRELADKLDPHSLARNIGAVRALSKWADANEYIDRPFRFGTEFSLPSQKSLRKAKKEAGVRVFSAEQVKKVVQSADPVMRALFLLALNGGIGNTDLSNLRKSDVAGGLLKFERTKTGVERLVPLWRETVRALAEAEPWRVPPKDGARADRLFLTPKGNPLVRDSFEGGKLASSIDSIGVRFNALAKSLVIPRTFYDARTTFQTIGDERGPAHVVRHIMGHALRGDDMSGRYRQSIPASELEAVVAHVRKRLGLSRIAWKAPGAPAPKPPPKAKGRRGGTASKPQRLPAGIAT